MLRESTHAKRSSQMSTQTPTQTLTKTLRIKTSSFDAPWISAVVFASVLLATLAAVTSMVVSFHTNQAMIEQVQSTDLWSHFQSKSIKSMILTTKIELLEASGSKPGVSAADPQKVSDYKKEQDDLFLQAMAKEASALNHFRLHQIFARGLTLFEVGIGIIAISLLTRRRHYSLLGIGFGLAGLVFFIQGLLWIG